MIDLAQLSIVGPLLCSRQHQANVEEFQGEVILLQESGVPEEGQVPGLGRVPGMGQATKWGSLISLLEGDKSR